MSSPEPSWRVYLREWLIVYTSDASGPEGADECWDHYVGTYKGRVREEDRQVVAVNHEKPGAGLYSLELRLPNLRGEFREHRDASALASESRTAVVVQRGSPAEQELLDYGRKMLPAAVATDVTAGHGEEERA